MRKYVLGNWKMQNGLTDVNGYIQELVSLVKSRDHVVGIAPSFVMLSNTRSALDCHDTDLWLGAQNMSEYEQGAHTGSVSAGMLQSCGVQFVLLGHSECRSELGDDNNRIAKKIRLACDYGMLPVLCIGESMETRSEGATTAFLEQQIRECLSLAQPEDGVVIAYEPLWSIGSGQAANVQDVQKVVAHCKRVVMEILSHHVPILYGGSVTEDNAKEFSQRADVDGLLVGGASLRPHTFAKVVLQFLGEEE